jgi:hypothetical protein
VLCRTEAAGDFDGCELIVTLVSRCGCNMGGVQLLKEPKMNRQSMHICSDVFSVDLDDDLESGTLAFVLKDASSLVEVRLPTKGIVALRDTLIDLSEDPAERPERPVKPAIFGPSYAQWEEDLGEKWEGDFGEIRLREAAY